MAYLGRQSFNRLFLKSIVMLHRTSFMPIHESQIRPPRGCENFCISHRCYIIDGKIFIVSFAVSLYCLLLATAGHVTSIRAPTAALTSTSELKSSIWANSSALQTHSCIVFPTFPCQEFMTELKTENCVSCVFEYFACKEEVSAVNFGSMYLCDVLRL